MEIILLRHGKPEVELSGWKSAEEFKQLASAYAQSGIQGHPPSSIFEKFKSHYVVCSNLNRSVKSANIIGYKEIHLEDKIFSESEIPHHDRSIIKIPMTIWLVYLRLRWLFGFSKNGESFLEANKRAELAANKLINLAEENEKVILVGHGLMNRLIARQLRLQNWNGPTSPGKRYWEYGNYIFQ